MLDAGQAIDIIFSMATGRNRESLILTIEAGTGEREDLELVGTGGKVRVGIGGPGHRSAVWNIWAPPNKSDVYVAPRDIAGVQKFSLHESGDWRYQWVSTKQAELFTAKGNRVIDQWARPAAGPAGWTTALSIFVPADDVCDVPDDGQADEGVEWIPEPRSGSVVGIHVVVADRNGGTMRIRKAAPLGAFPLADGRAVIVVVSVRSADKALETWLAEQRARVLAAMARSRREVVGTLWAGLIGSDERGNRVVWELAVQALPALGVPAETG